MPLSITDDRITSDVTTHTAIRQTPNSWAVSWLDRHIGYSLAISAMMIAEIVAVPECSGVDGVVQLRALAAELGFEPADAERLVTETLPPAPVHDTHAIPAGDEPEPVSAAQFDEAIAIVMERPSDEPLSLSEVRQVRAALDAGRRLAGGHVEPAKTHDLWVRKQLFGTLVAAESETDDRRVFILAGSVLDLGRVLAVLTPAQRQLLVDDLTGGES